MADSLPALLKQGHIESRGLSSEEELAEVIALLKSDGDLSLAAAKALISLLNVPPEKQKGKVPASRISAVIVSKDSGCIEKLLKLGIDGKLVIHNEIKKNEIVLGDIIGKGKAGNVYEGKWNEKVVAIKKFNNSDKIDDVEFQKELGIMSLLDQPSLILPCFGGCSKKGAKFIVSELMQATLYELLHDSSFDLSPSVGMLIALSVAKSAEYLHSCDIIHRDLKSLNILVNSKFEVKICDFGLSRVIDHTHNMTGNVGTVAWVAPELFQEKKNYSYQADVYSFAVICWELVSRKIPFEESEAFSIPLLVLKGKRPALPKEGNKDFCKLIKKMWNQKPEKRPLFPAVVKSITEILHKSPKGKKPTVEKVELNLVGNYALEKKPSGWVLKTLS